MEGSDPKEKLQKSYISGLKANFMVWPLVQVDELQVCAARFEGIGRQLCQLGLELFPEFSQPRINTVKGCVGSFLRLRVGDLHICED